jgi:hypothetical protein
MQDAGGKMQDDVPVVCRQGGAILYLASCFLHP